MLADGAGLRGHRARAARAARGPRVRRAQRALRLWLHPPRIRARWTATGARPACAPCACRARCIRRCAHHNLDARHRTPRDPASSNRHRAMPDAQVLLEFWRRLRAGVAARRSCNARWSTARCASRCPPRCRRTLPTTCPKSPGVYRFYRRERGGAGHSFICRQGQQPARARARIISAPAPAMRKSRDSPRRCAASNGPKPRASSAHCCWRRAKSASGNRCTTAQLRGNGARFTWLFDDGDAPPHARGDSTATVLRSGNAFGTYRAARMRGARSRAWRASIAGVSSC